MTFRYVVMAEALVTTLRGLPVFLPDGRRLGLVHDTVIEVEHWTTSHIFVVDCAEDIVAGSVHVAIPWNWVRGIEDIVILRWFPPTPIPESP